MNKTIWIESDHDSSVLLNLLLARLPDGAGKPHAQFKIIPKKDHSFVLEIDSKSRIAAGPLFETFHLIESIIHHWVLPYENFDIILHGAAVYHVPSGKVILLLGPTLSGKSSLTMALVRSGRFLYLGEDGVGLHDGTLISIPFLKPLRIRFGLEESVSHSKDWEIFRGSSSRFVYVIPPAEAVLSEREAPKPSAIIFPHYSQGGHSRFDPIRKGQLLAFLAGHSMNGPSFFMRRGLATLSILSSQVVGADFFWSDIEEAVQAVEGFI